MTPQKVLLSVFLAATACGPEVAEERASSAASAEPILAIAEGDGHSEELALVRGADGTWRPAAFDRDSFAPIPPRANERIAAFRIAWDTSVTFCDAATIEQKLFSADPAAVAGFYREASFDQQRIAGDVFGPITINRGEGCDVGGWAEQVDAQAEKQGIDLSGYTRRMYLLPGAPCWWSGLAELGGRRSWINGGSCNNPTLLAHELGHNFGMHHASSPGSEYGDDSDVMGTAGPLRGFNAPHLIAAGWSPGAPLIELGGRFDGELRSLLGGEGTRVIRAARGGGTQLYLSLRSSVGPDRRLDPRFFDRISIHRGGPGTLVQTQLLAIVAPGERYSDPESLLELEVHRAADHRASISAWIRCAPAEPVFGAEPIWVRPGGHATGRVWIENRDRGGCDPRGFAVDPASTRELQVAVALPEGEVPPGGLVEGSAAVEVRRSAAAGARSIPIIVRSGEGRSAAALTVFVDAEAPAVPESVAVHLPDPRRPEVAIGFWSFGDDSGEVGFRVERDGGITLVHDPKPISGWVELVDRAVPAGLRRYRVSAFDRAGNASAFSEEVWVVVRGR
jgi:hypothetical protein